MFCNTLQPLEVRARHKTAAHRGRGRGPSQRPSVTCICISTASDEELCCYFRKTVIEQKRGSLLARSFFSFFLIGSEVCIQLSVGAHFLVGSPSSPAGMTGQALLSQWMKQGRVRNPAGWVETCARGGREEDCWRLMSELWLARKYRITSLLVRGTEGCYRDPKRGGEG